MNRRSFLVLFLMASDFALSQTAIEDMITANNLAIVREEGSFVNIGDKFVLLVGRNYKATQHSSFCDS